MSDRQERIDLLLEAAGKLVDLDEEHDDASDAVRWTEIGRYAVEGLYATGVRVIDETRREEAEELVALKYGWTSTPGEVETWCDKHGMPWRYFQGKIVVLFDSDPGLEVRRILKASGFNGRKVGRGNSLEVPWTHRLMGSWLDSKKGNARAYREVIERGGSVSEAQDAADQASRDAAPADDRPEAEKLAAAGSWA